MIDDQCRNVYVANSELRRIEIYAVATGALQGTVALNGAVRSMDISPDGETMYVSLVGQRNVAIVTLSARAITGGIVTPIQDFEPGELAVAGDGTVIYLISNPNSSATPHAVKWRSGDATPTFISKYDPAVPLADPDVPFRVVRNIDRSFVNIAFLSQYYYQIPYDIARYITATGQIEKLRLPRNSAGAIYSNRTGTTHVLADYYLVVFDANFVDQASYEFVEARGAALNSEGTTLYFSANGKQVRVFDVTAKVIGGAISIGDTISSAVGRIALSRDGTLLAVTTDTGFSLVRADSRDDESFSFIANSTTFPGPQSFLRFHNTGTTADNVSVQLKDSQTGEIIADWTSPTIPPNAAPQFGVDLIEAQGAVRPGRPARYVAVVKPRITGTFAHVVWRPNAPITNVSTCTAGPAETDRVAHVHTSYMDEGYQSYLNFVNPTPSGVTPIVRVFNATTGELLSRTNFRDIPPGVGRWFSVRDLERTLQIKPASYLTHYVFQVTGYTALETEFAGYVQHYVDNRNGGVMADMTTACAMPWSTFPLIPATRG